jgi:transposase-like protein
MAGERSKYGKIKRRRISDKKFRVLRRCFCVDSTALQAAEICLVNRNTAQRYFAYFKRLVVEAAWEERQRYQIGNGVEVDESYFGPRRVRGKRGRGASKKVVVFGLLKRNGKVFTQVISRASQREILPIIRQTVRSGSDIYSDGWRSYDALAIYGYNHKKVKHQDNEFAVGDNHINGIESFWSYTKRRLAKFNGFEREQFKRYLLESEYRFNHRNDMAEQLQRLIKKDRVSGVI